VQQTIPVRQTYAAGVESGADERERLILEHLPQVRLIARRIHERLPESVSLEDLISTGVVGLIAAIDHFDPSHNVKLKTYAEYKIRGAILDSLRGLDWAPRQQRKKSKQIEAAIAGRQRMHHSAREEIAAELKLSTEEYHEWLGHCGVNQGSLESNSGEEQGRDLLKPSLTTKTGRAGSWNAMSWRNCSRKPSSGCQVERQLSLYYHEELTLREIAKVVKVHEPRSRLSLRPSCASDLHEKRWPRKSFRQTGTS
jgi:RNA polymerase sigma factor for flagellar operon FliA